MRCMACLALAVLLFATQGGAAARHCHQREPSGLATLLHTLNKVSADWRQHTLLQSASGGLLTGPARVALPGGADGNVGDAAGNPDTLAREQRRLGWLMWPACTQVHCLWLQQPSHKQPQLYTDVPLRNAAATRRWLLQSAADSGSKGWRPGAPEAPHGSVPRVHVVGVTLACVGTAVLLAFAARQAMAWLERTRRPGYVELQELDTAYHGPSAWLSGLARGVVGRG